MFNFESEPIPEKSTKEILYEPLSSCCYIPSIRGKYGDIIMPEMRSKIPAGHICLGLTSYDEDAELVTIPYNRQSFGMLIIGMRGSGKTQLAKTIGIDQIHGVYGQYLFGIDPKHEYLNLDQPQDDPELIERLNRVGLRPQGYEPVYVMQRHLLKNNTGIPQRNKIRQFALQVKDFNVLNPALRIEMWCRFLNIKQASPAGQALRRVIYQRPRNIAHMLDLIEKDIRKQKMERGARGTSYQLLSNFRDKIFNEELMDHQKLRFDFPLELATNKIVFLEVELNMEEIVAQIGVRLALENLISDKQHNMNTSNKSKTRGFLDMPVCVFCDEIDVLAPSNELQGNMLGSRVPPARQAMRDILTKHRQLGFSLIGMTQKPNMVDRFILDQCSHILTTKLINPEQKAILAERGIPPSIIQEAEKLEWDDLSPVKQWIHISPDTEHGIKIFYPLPPRSKIWRESQRV